MSSRTLSTLLPPVIFASSLGPALLMATDFDVFDSTVQVDNTFIQNTQTPPVVLAAGDQVTFQGSIIVPGANDAVFISPVPSGLTLTFTEGSITLGSLEDGVDIDQAFDGNFVNRGLIQSTFQEGVDMGDLFSGSFMNFGSIIGGVLGDGIQFESDVTGSFSNFGSISGQEDGIIIEGLFLGSFLNEGEIIGGDDGVNVDLNVGVGATLINNGLIQGQVGGLDLDRNLNGTVINNGVIRGLSIGGPDAGFEVGRDIGNQGVFTNRGSIFGGTAGALIIQDLLGQANNYGLIQGGIDGFNVNRNLIGTLNNFGEIRGPNIGVVVGTRLEGTLFNCGIIEGTNSVGIRAFRTIGTIHNHGGRISGAVAAIRLGTGDGTVILSGPSHIEGLIGGAAGNDTIRFQDMRGINAAKQAELAALAAADPAAGSVVLFGETIAWQGIEDIQADAPTLLSYESLISGAGLGSYAVSLDNLNGLNDSLREFLKSLNDTPINTLNDIVRNSSGQSLIASFRDLQREQDVNFFQLFSNQFSSLRGDVTGRPAPAVQAQNSGGFLTREVPIGMEVAQVNDESNGWITNYVGSSNQDRNGSRAAGDYDQTTILFGVGSDKTDQWYAGYFGGYSRNEGQADQFGTGLETNGGWIGGNAQFRNGDVFATLVGAIGLQDFDSVRRDFIGRRYDGDSEVFSSFFYSQVGKDFWLGDENNARITPYLGMTLSLDVLDGFSESGPVGTSLRFDDESYFLFQTVVGISAAGYRETKKGWIRPRADLAWWHAYGDDSFGSGLATPGLINAFQVGIPDSNRNRGVFQAGIEFGLNQWESWWFEAGYFGVVGDDGYTSNGGTFGARVEF
ncbi:MAG: autotransporter outer membrane beta-barrel domain-containing protein [Verrucomicrobiota bacterium]